MNFWVYLLCCSNGTYYVGHTDDVVRRLEEHNTGKGAEHTRKYRPVHLLYTEPFDAERDAVRREMQIKHWSRAQKAGGTTNRITAQHNSARHGGKQAEIMTKLLRFLPALA